MICYLLRQTHNQLNLLKQINKDDFTAKNDSQMFYARELSIVFGEVILFCVLKLLLLFMYSLFLLQYLILKQFIEMTSSPNLDGPHKLVLHKLASLYGFWLVEKHLSIMYEGMFLNFDYTRNFNINYFLFLL